MQSIYVSSLRQAIREQNLEKLASQLESIVPDLRHQYSSFVVDTPYLNMKVRSLHAFQISMVQQAIIKLGIEKRDTIHIADIGDSSGTHIQYLNNLYNNIESYSVNLDEIAVKKIQAKGLKAICARAEDLSNANMQADLFLSFEMLEHLHDPVNFLRSVSENSKCHGFVITIPYLAQSRVGLHHIRKGSNTRVTAEDVHIFELSPSSWKLLFKHAGWEVVHERIYLQYPLKHPLRATKRYWKYSDFEGFYGIVLKRDPTWKDLYTDW